MWACPDLLCRIYWKRLSESCNDTNSSISGMDVQVIYHTECERDEGTNACMRGTNQNILYISKEIKH